MVDLPELWPEDFDGFFEELRNHEHRPFPWQRRLAQRVVKEGWPRVIDLPTAAGKTAVIDIAVFSLALDVHDLAARKAPLRVFFVVDRRVIVDEAFEHAKAIAQKLRTATSGVLKTVATRLRRLSGNDGPPLVAAVLRGGIYREDGWARMPVQPLVAVSTVDQVGSRLLFRGYGVGDRMKSIHAGLVGHDSLIFLDEAHLSAPFEDTLKALERYRTWADQPLPSRVGVVRMSATQASAEESTFSLTDEDRHDAELKLRLEAHKKAFLPEPSGDPPPKRSEKSKWDAWRRQRVKRDEEFAEKLASEAKALLSEARCVGVIANRVGVARMASDQLRRDPALGADVVLLTGRSRPMDRDTIVRDIWDRARAGRRRCTGNPLVIVATQCIEAGANLDFDALVTECASLDALRQRFGRLDRLGRITQEIGEARAVILARRDTLDDDPIYGPALGATWKWLNDQATHATKRKKRKVKDPTGDESHVDFGMAWMTLPPPQTLRGLLAPRPQAPVLLPAHLDAWAQTCPRPAIEPDVSLWLHGPVQGAQDVQIVWRADLPEERPEQWASIMALCPPGSAECLPVPFHAAKAWLAQQSIPDVTDVESESNVEDPPQEMRSNPSGQTPSARKALRWCGERKDGTEPITASELHPGNTIVVPSSSAWGGADQYGWAPHSTHPVSDLGDRAQLEQRGRATLRIKPELVSGWLEAQSPRLDLIKRLAESFSEEDDNQEEPDIDRFLKELEETPETHSWVREAAKRLRQDRYRLVLTHPAGGTVLRGSRRKPYDSVTQAEREDATEPDFTSEDDSSCFLHHPPQPAFLIQHGQGVGDRARHFGERCGLPPLVVNALFRAGWFHDIGKADPRFQCWMHGGDEVKAAVADELLAKSGMQDRRAREWARQLAHYPESARHELLSLAMIENELEASGVEDRELVLHLIASHHGYCRPFAPVVDDPNPVDAALGLHGRTYTARSDKASVYARLDSGVSERFWRLVERYGWLGLAYLEAILRLADHRQSEAEEEGQE